MSIKVAGRVLVVLGAIAELSGVCPLAAASQDKKSPVDLVQITLSMPGKVKAGKTFRIRDEVESVGDLTAAQSVTYFYLSTDDILDETDKPLVGRRVPPMPPGTTSGEFTNVVVPETVTPGTYYLIAKANATRTVDERYLDNNTKATKFVVQPAEPKK